MLQVLVDYDQVQAKIKSNIFKIIWLRFFYFTMFFWLFDTSGASIVAFFFCLEMCVSMCEKKEKRKKNWERATNVWIISSVRSRDREKERKDDIVDDASLLLVPSERCVVIFFSCICQMKGRKKSLMHLLESKIIIHYFFYHNENK